MESKTTHTTPVDPQTTQRTTVESRATQRATVESKATQTFPVKSSSMSSIFLSDSETEDLETEDLELSLKLEDEMKPNERELDTFINIYILQDTSTKSCSLINVLMMKALLNSFHMPLTSHSVTKPLLKSVISKTFLMKTLGPVSSDLLTLERTHS